MSLTHDEMARLLEAAYEKRERIRRARNEEDYPATSDAVDELVRLALDEMTPIYDARRYAARDYLWQMCAPYSVREQPIESLYSELGDDVEAHTIKPDGAAAAERASIKVPPGYEALGEALRAALEQSAAGKGRERHANERPFEHQPIMEIAREQGLGFPMGQARKKVGEAAGMLRRGEPASARAELLGAIVYLAAAVLAIEEGMR